MPNTLASFWLLAVLFLSLIQYRLLGGRITIGLGRLLLVFSYGAAGASILSLAAHRIALIAFDNSVVAWSIGPLLEEFTKALPLLILAYGFSGYRRLTIADYTLVGFASGLGFTFTETNLRTIIHGGFASFDVWPSEPVDSFGESTYWAAGHPLWTAFIGLGIGIGIRLWPKNALHLGPAVMAVVLVCFEHVITNWKGVHTEYFFGQIQSIGRAPEWIEAIFSVDLHGRLVMLLLPSLLLVATVVEGLWVSRARVDSRELMLADEGVRPLVIREWIAQARAIPRGRAEFMRIARYFRRRRELDLATAELAREAGHLDLKAAAVFLNRLITHEREELDVPLPARWLPAPGATKQALLSFMRRNRLGIFVMAAIVVLFMIAPQALPEWLRSLLFGPIFALATILMGAALFLWRVRAFKERGWPDPSRTDGETLMAFHLRAMLLGTSALSLGFGIVAWFVSRRLLAPAESLYITNAWIDWLNQGGGGPTLIGLGALAGSALADPNAPDPCADLRREAKLGDQRIKELERLARDWKRPQPPPGDWPAGRRPTDQLLPKLDDDSWTRRFLDAAGNTKVGKRIITICKPILGPGGVVRGYAMVEQEVDDTPANGGNLAPQGGGDPTTIMLPGGRRLHVDPFEEWLTGKSAVQEALDSERELQKRRGAALAGCEQIGAQDMPQDRAVPARPTAAGKSPRGDLHTRDKDQSPEAQAARDAANKPPNHGPNDILNQPLGQDPPKDSASANNPPADDLRTRDRDQSPEAQAARDAANKPPNHGPNDILNQPLGQDPPRDSASANNPPADDLHTRDKDQSPEAQAARDAANKPPSYGPNDILNQPLGQDPPKDPASANNPPADDLHTRDRDQSPEAQAARDAANKPPNYGPNDILNQPLGQDPPKDSASANNPPADDLHTRDKDQSPEAQAGRDKANQPVASAQDDGRGDGGNGREDGARKDPPPADDHPHTVDRDDSPEARKGRDEANKAPTPPPDYDPLKGIKSDQSLDDLRARAQAQNIALEREGRYRAPTIAAGQDDVGPQLSEEEKKAFFERIGEGKYMKEFNEKLADIDQKIRALGGDPNTPPRARFGEPTDWYQFDDGRKLVGPQLNPLEGLRSQTESDIELLKRIKADTIIRRQTYIDSNGDIDAVNWYDDDQKRRILYNNLKTTSDMAGGAGQASAVETLGGLSSGGGPHADGRPGGFGPERPSGGAPEGGGAIEGGGGSSAPRGGTPESAPVETAPVEKAPVEAQIKGEPAKAFDEPAQGRHDGKTEVGQAPDSRAERAGSDTIKDAPAKVSESKVGDTVKEPTGETAGGNPPEAYKGADKNWREAPIDPDGKPGTRLPPDHDPIAIDPTDPPIDPRTGKPFPEGGRPPSEIEHIGGGKAATADGSATTKIEGQGKAALDNPPENYRGQDRDWRSAPKSDDERWGTRKQYDPYKIDPHDPPIDPRTGKPIPEEGGHALPGNEMPKGAEPKAGTPGTETVDVKPGEAALPRGAEPAQKPAGAPEPQLGKPGTETADLTPKASEPAIDQASTPSSQPDPGKTAKVDVGIPGDKATGPKGTQVLDRGELPDGGKTPGGGIETAPDGTHPIRISRKELAERLNEPIDPATPRPLDAPDKPAAPPPELPKAKLPETVERPRPADMTDKPAGPPDSTPAEEPPPNSRRANWEAAQHKAAGVLSDEHVAPYKDGIQQLRDTIDPKTGEPYGPAGPCEATKTLLERPEYQGARSETVKVGELNHEIIVTREGNVVDPFAQQAIRDGHVNADTVKGTPGLSDAVAKGVFSPKQWKAFSGKAPPPALR